MLYMCTSKLTFWTTLRPRPRTNTRTTARRPCYKFMIPLWTCALKKTCMARDGNGAGLLSAIHVVVVVVDTGEEDSKTPMQWVRAHLP